MKSKQSLIRLAIGQILISAYELSNILGYRSIGPTAKLLLAAS